MPRATSEEWARYYEGADQRRRLVGDPLDRYLDRAGTREKRYFISASVILLTAVVAFYVLLVR